MFFTGDLDRGSGEPKSTRFDLAAADASLHRLEIMLAKFCDDEGRRVWPFGRWGAGVSHDRGEAFSRLSRAVAAE